ncbi:Gfo/Idh/MocA family protein [Paenibacillus silviterrae]|uniref:Gfo/Idh/MocA family protein n=1 Tax=Paenibacillus silviterrae TaxID=3242194 RepID=UPI002543875C|nr:Gfo/Idh/MocA family oxidoreductase [Paenibacillus chinjuensis]
MNMRIGIVGTGGFAKKHAGIVSRMDGCEVVGFTGTSLEKAEKAASGYSAAAGYEQVEAMLDKEKPDAVYICVPPMAHGPIERSLIERGIPFLVEKPLGAEGTIPGELAKQITEKQLITSVGYHLRYTDGAQKTKELLEGRYVGLANGYWLGSMPGVAWWRTLQGSGGQFVEQTTHITDLVRYFCGEVSEVYAQFNRVVMHERVPGTEVPDNGVVTLKLRSGAVVSLTNTCMLPINHTSGLDLVTDLGVVEFRAHAVRDIRKGQITEFLNLTDPYVKENEAFLHAVRTGDTSRIRSTYEDAHQTHLVSMAAVRSAETGIPVRL